MEEEEEEEEEEEGEEEKVVDKGNDANKDIGGRVEEGRHK
jgi:hypothetical protein